MSIALMESLARVMAIRDVSTHQHSLRVQRYAVALAGEACIGDERMREAISAAALLHDIGKLGIPDRVLDKPGPLTVDEYEQVKLHAIIGADLLASVSYPGQLALIVRHHHERWDGSGYPDRLRGEEIPVAARVLAIADGYDALTTDRPYRRGLSHDCALAIIQQGRGTMYDPAIADIFVQIAERLQSAGANERDRQSPAHTYAQRLCEARAL